MVTKNKSQYYNWSGTVKWARVYEPDDFMNTLNWKVDFYPGNEDIVKDIKSTGVMGKFKTDKETGALYYTFKRPVKKMIKGEWVYFCPPVIYGADGKELVHYTNGNGEKITQYNEAGFTPTQVGETLLIGNGSKVILNVQVYNTSFGPGNRLLGLKVIDLVEYVKSDAPPSYEKEEETATPATDSTSDEESPW